MLKKVLLVDDDRDETELFQLALSTVRPDIGLATARTGIEALALLHSDIQVDVIFLDINMPFMDGWECLSSLKADPALNHIPVIMLSTADDKGSIERALSHGAAAYLVKPQTFGELKDILRIVLSKDDMEELSAVKAKGLHVLSFTKG